MKSPENPNKDHYTDVEVSEKLGKSIMAVWKMANRGELPSKRVDGKRVYPKELIDSMPLARQAASGHLTSRSNTSGKNSTPIATEPRRRAKTDDTGRSKYFTLEQIAFALQRTQRDIDRMIQWGEIKAETIDGRSWVSTEEVERIISQREPQRQVKIRGRLPQPREISEQSRPSYSLERKQSEVQTNQDSEAALAEDAFADDRYYTPGQAALLLGKDSFEIKRMIRREVLPVVSVNRYQWIPEQSVESLLTESARHRWRKQENRPKAYRIRKSEIQGTNSPERNDRKADKNVNESEASVRLDSPQDASQVSSAPSQAQSETALEEVIEMLRNELRAERELNQRLTQELEQERADRAQEIQNARYEIDQSSAQTENLRRDYAMQSETLQEDLEEERRRRLDSEQRAKELEDQLEKQKEQKLAIEEPLGNKAANEDFYGQLRTGVKGVVDSLRDSISREDEDERWRGLELALEDSKQKLEEERNRRLKREEWVADMRAKLERNEASNIELREALSSEKEKALRLEENQRVLDEVRRLLEMQPAPPLERTEIIAPNKNSEEEPDESPDELIIQTRHGLWTFRPPFALENDEIELLRLVAGEDEITAEQIKTKSGRRRAADDLDELLDRLHAAGVEPIKEINDRYSFDPNFLQD